MMSSDRSRYDGAWPIFIMMACLLINPAGLKCAKELYEERPIAAFVYLFLLITIPFIYLRFFGKK